MYEDPADTFVATFVGQPPMNLLTYDHQLIGFRPEQFLPRGVFGATEPLRTFPFAVRRVEYLGSDRYVYGTVPGASGDATIIAKLHGHIALEIAEGQTHEFAVPERSLRYFDAASGARLAR